MHFGTRQRSGGDNFRIADHPPRNHVNERVAYLLNTTAQTAAFVDRVGRANFGILYDTHQAHHEENNISAAIAAANHRINHVHFNENQRGTLGTGVVDWIGTVKALKKIHYQRWIMVQSFADDVPPLSEKAHVWRNCFQSKEEVYKKGILWRPCYSL